jgi:hypothetical protein
MREGIRNQSGTRPRILWSGATLVTIGVSVLLLAGEWFAAFDACLANTSCVPPSSVSTLEWYLAMMVVGVAVTVGGAVSTLIGFRTGPTSPTPF